MQSSELTIVMALKDRQPFTYRWMRYMCDMKCSYKILIADGGEDLSIEEHLRNTENYPGLDYEYIRYPYDDYLKRYLGKLRDVVSRVKTKYLLIADNDDFYLLDRIPKILSFLDLNDDFVACRGQLVNLKLMSNAFEYVARTQGNRYLTTPILADSIENDCPFERVESLCKNMSKFDYYSNWYCVIRSAALSDIWESIFELNISDMIVNEMLTHILMNMRGKIKIFAEPFYIRQGNTSLYGDTLVRNNEFLERWVINDSISEFSLAIDRLIPVKSIVERERLLKAVAAWLEVFVSNIYNGRELTKPANYLFLLKLKASEFSPVVKVYRLLTYLTQTVKGKRSDLRVIEPYILS